jgi:hypothetical protein
VPILYLCPGCMALCRSGFDETPCEAGDAVSRCRTAAEDQSDHVRRRTGAADVAADGHGRAVLGSPSGDRGHAHREALEHGLSLGGGSTGGSRGKGQRASRTPRRWGQPLLRHLHACVPHPAPRHQSHRAHSDGAAQHHQHDGQEGQFAHGADRTDQVRPPSPDRFTVPSWSAAYNSCSVCATNAAG